MSFSQLPEAEFTVMQTIWGQDVPISKTKIAKLLMPHRGWKPQTVRTLLDRLEEKSFLSSEKQGKERYYQPLVAREDYLRQETSRFLRDFHRNSLTGLMTSLIYDNNIDDKELSDLTEWLATKKRG